MASIINVQGKWRAQVRRKGYQVYTRTFRTKAEASSWANGIEADIDRGVIPSPRAVAGRNYTVADLIAEYRRLRSGSRPISDVSTEHYTLQALVAGLGDLDVSRLRTDDIVGYAQRRRDMGAGPYTVNMDISKMGTVLRLVSAMRGMQIPDVVQQSRPVLSHLNLIGGGGKRERRPTEDELDRILEYLEQRHSQIYADAVRFAVGTAMRRGEITSILWQDLDEAKRLVLVHDRKDPRNKVGNDQWVPLLAATWDLVVKQPRGDIRIFPIGESMLSKAFTGACRELSIPDLHFHDLRHHAISLLFEQGYRIEQVALVSGHKSWTHLRRYTNLRPEDLHQGPHV